jgi:hypothetical protein
VLTQLRDVVTLREREFNLVRTLMKIPPLASKAFSVRWAERLWHSETALHSTAEKHMGDD